MDEIDLFIQQNPSFRGLSRDIIQGILNQRGGVQQPTNAVPNAFDANSGNLFPQNPQQNIPASPVVNVGGDTDYTQVFGVPEQQFAPIENPTFSEANMGYGQNPFAPQQTGSAMAQTGGMGSLPWGTGITGLAELGVGLYNAYQHRNDKLEPYTLTPEMQRSVNEGNALRDTGFTPSEMASYENRLASDTMAKWNRAVEIAGGQASQAIVSALRTQGFDARNQMAIADANMRRQNRSMSDQLNQVTQNLKNMNVQTQQQQYWANQQATAKALNAGLQNVGIFANLLAL